jgi:hypothetical protein
MHANLGGPECMHLASLISHLSSLPSHLSPLISPLSSRPSCLSVTLGRYYWKTASSSRSLPPLDSLAARTDAAGLFDARLSEPQEPNFPRRSLHLM